MTPRDFALASKFDDVIAWHATICMINDCGPVEIPYRSILPRDVDNLLCPGRHISADDVAINWLTLIPQCVGTGQAAGVAAAVAVADGTTAREVNIKKCRISALSRMYRCPGIRGRTRTIQRAARNMNMACIPSSPKK